ncbi:MAG: MFS transporter [Planctomycetes bacterium]|nr:MFS transporter [Planctomycetota bacterium]
MLDRTRRQLRIAWRRAFRQRRIDPAELPGIMRKHIYTGVMGNVWASMVTGLFFVTFGNRVGMSEWLWGVMSGISSIVLAAQLVSAWLTQRVGHRKMVWFVCALAGRLLRLMSILTALILYRLGSPAAATALIVGVCLCNFCGAVATPPWMSWLADLIPEHKHGGFWGRRASWIDAAVMLSVVPTGLMLDCVPAAWKLPALVGVFVLATIVGVVDLFIHNTLPEPPLAKPREAHYFRHLAMPLRDRAFRPWLRFNFCWTFAMTLGGSLSLVYFTKHLGIDRNLLAGIIVLNIIPCLGSILVGSKSGKVVDRVGSKPVLWWGHFFWAMLPSLWIFATPATAMIWLTVQGVISGTASRAANTAANKLVTRFPAPQDVAVYTAVSACTASLASAVGCFSAGLVLRLLKGWSVTFLGWTFIGFHVLFILSLALRLASALFLIHPVLEASPSARSASHAVSPPG